MGSTRNHAQPALFKMLLLHIQVEIVPTGNCSHKPRLSPPRKGCPFYTSRMKWCLRGNLPQNHAQRTLHKMFLLHIQAGMVSMGDLLPQNHAQYTLYGMLLLHIQG